MADGIRELFFGTPSRELVEAVEPRRTFDDVVLPPPTLRALNHALALVRKHDLIFHQWGLAERHSTGLGLAFHFAGPPGTGKTICAEALAYALGKRLLVVRYSELESRWVGQTAKHVASVFRAAERQNAVLFFDEADAVAGRRFTSLSAAYEREANAVVKIGGVRTLFRMPDLLSLGLGGGSLVSDDGRRVGPQSLGYRLVEDSLVFGGTTLTTTDVAVAAGLLDLGDRRRVAALPADAVKTTLARVHAMIDEGVDRMKTDAREEPLIAVGGGCFLVPERLPGVSEVVHVRHQAVANAVGAAIAQVSGEVDQIFQNLTRDAAIAEARRVAEDRAVAGGADAGSLQLVEVEDLPLAYLPGNSLRVRVRVVGDIAERPAPQRSR